MATPRQEQLRNVRMVKEWLQMPAWTQVMKPFLEKELAVTIEQMLATNEPLIEQEKKADARALKRFMTQLEDFSSIRS